MEKDYGSWSLVKIKQELKKRRARLNGRKADLVARRYAKLNKSNVSENDVGHEKANPDYDQMSIKVEDDMEPEDSKPYLPLREFFFPPSRNISSYNICRLCGTKLENEECTHSENDVFSDDYPEKIFKCTALRVIPGDGLPTKMCIQCTTSLNKANDFRIICIKTTNFLLNFTFQTHSEQNEASVEMRAEPLCTETMESANDGDTQESIDSPKKANMDYDVESGDDIFCDKGFNDEHCSDQGKDLDDVISDKAFNVKYCSDQDKDLDVISDKASNDKYCSDQDKDIDDMISDKADDEHCGDQNKDSDDEWDERDTRKPTFDPILEKKFRMATRDFVSYKTGGKTKVVCPFCPAIFDMEVYSELQPHLESHLRCIKRDFRCRYSDCYEIFGTHRTRVVHEGTDHGMQQFLVLRKLFCEHCGKWVTKRTYFWSHKWRGKESEYLYCDMCSFQSREKSHLSQHIRRNHITKLVQCKLCKEKLPMNKIRPHQRNIHQLKITCSYCDKEFLRGNIKGHLRTHTGEKPFSCKDCGMEFTFRVSLKTHRKRYHNDDMFKNTTKL